MDLCKDVALVLMGSRLLPRPRRSGKTTKVIEMVKKELSAGRDACIVYGVGGADGARHYPKGIKACYYHYVGKHLRGFRGKFFTDEVGPAEVYLLKTIFGEDNYGGGFYTPRGSDA